MKVSLKKILFIVFAFTGLYLQSYSQNAPDIEWKKVTWAPRNIQGSTQQQSESGEDWWYSHKNYYTGNSHQGYIGVGYTSLVVTPSTKSTASQVIDDGLQYCYNPVANLSFSGVNCPDFENDGQRRTPPRGKVALMDLKGNYSWYRVLCMGELGEVIQDGNYFYVIGVHSGVKTYNKTSFLSYNPTASNPTNNFSSSNLPGFVCGNEDYRHLYVAKLDINGTVIWQYLYGMRDYSPDPGQAYYHESYGYDLIKSTNGNLVAVGYASNTNRAVHQPFVLEINPANGHLLNKTLLPLPSITNSSGDAINVGEATSIVEVGTSGTYAVSTHYSFNNTNYLDLNRAALWSINSNLSINSNWTTNPIVFTSNDPVNKNSNIWEVKYHSQNQEILAPVIRNCKWCGSAGADNWGEAVIYRISGSGIFASSGSNPAIMGPVNAFDLRVGVEETSDGGFVAVSSTRRESFSPPNDIEMGYMASCTSLPATYDYWDTDAFVAKFSPAGSKVWEKIFDVEEGRPRESLPGDLKRQECMYKVTEAELGGYIISGNSSHNFDDNYMVKLYGDCGTNVTYDLQPLFSDGAINFPNNVPVMTWNTSMKVMGQVMIGAGQTLIITGANTVIEFADSRSVGITTNITVLPGGKLVVQDGATLTSLVSCPESMWDGVRVEGQTYLPQVQANQGFAVLTNNAQIKNARIGVLAGNLLFGNGGGIITANTAHFENNEIDVYLMPYQILTYPVQGSAVPGNNLSSFTKCSFISNRLLNDPNLTFNNGMRKANEWHVVLNQVRGVDFKACTFKMDLSTVGSGFSTETRGTGIFSFSSQFNVEPECSILNLAGQCLTGQPSVFENLREGVVAVSVNPLNTFKITGSNFNNCHSSIYQGGIDYSIVEKNNFLIDATIPDIPPGNCTADILGTCEKSFYYLNQCNGFSIQENSFIVDGQELAYGVVFNQTTGIGNEIYKNSLAGLKVGTQAQVDNPDLQIKCNQNSLVKETDIALTSGSLPEQGFCDNTPMGPANNRFSNSPTQESEIKVAAIASAFSYTQLPVSGYQLTDYTVGKVNPITCLSGGAGPLCPSKIAESCLVPCIDDLLNSSNYAMRTTERNSSIRYLLNDTVLPNRFSLIIELLKKSQDFRSQSNLAHCFRTLNNFSSSDSVIKAMQGIDSGSVSTKLLIILKEMQRQSKLLHELILDTTYVKELNALSSDIYNEGSANTQAIMSFHFGLPSFSIIEKFGNSNKVYSRDSLAPLIGKEGLNLFPNPSSGIVNIQFPVTDKGPSTINISSAVTGQLVQSFDEVIENEIVLNIESLMPGVYFINIHLDSGKNYQSKLILLK